MRSFFLAAAALAVAGLAPLATSTTARAEIEYAWCGYMRDVGQTCSFATQDQCRAWVVNGGDCFNNPRFMSNDLARKRRQ